MAGATITRPGADRRPLLAYLRVQRDREREMIALLRSASSRIDRHLAALPGDNVGDAVRRAQLARAQVAIHRELSQLWGALGSTVEAGRADAAAAAVEAMHPAGLLGSVFSAEDRAYMLRSAEETARRGIANVEARANLSSIPLAESVYNNAALSNGTVDTIINDALARGASAAELARDVKNYVRPDTRGGVRYAAMRLGRTELNNAFHAQQVVEAKKTPWTTAVRWNLSGSHPRPDECNEYADDVHYDGGEAGVWRPEDVPGKPHPNCLCFTTPETDSREDFIRKYEAGEFDDYLDAEFPGLPPRPRD